MSADVPDDGAKAEVSRQQQASDSWVKSYRYVRMGMVGLLAVLLVAVVYQTARQGGHLLGSVSAYYHTPAQAIFVGALIGLGACMIALRGTNDVEDVFLNLGGMFAAVVAIVPTSRGGDYKTANELCQLGAGPAVTEKASTGFDCPTIAALKAATKDNVDNNMIALLALGLLVLIPSLVSLLRDRKRNRTDQPPAPPAAPGAKPRPPSRTAWWGFVAACVVFVATAAVFWFSPDWFIDNAHYLAAGGLFLCIVAVAFANAFRRTGRAVSGDSYSLFAVVMLVATGVFAILWRFDGVSLFWLEIVVAAFFVLFWVGQTFEETMPAGLAGLRRWLGRLRLTRGGDRTAPKRA